MGQYQLITLADPINLSGSDTEQKEKGNVFKDGKRSRKEKGRKLEGKKGINGRKD